MVKVRVKSVLKPSSPSFGSLFQFLLHEVTKSIVTPPWIEY